MGIGYPIEEEWSTAGRALGCGLFCTDVTDKACLYFEIFSIKVVSGQSGIVCRNE